MNRKILLLAIAALASFRGIAAETPRLIVPVSYTHLTLPTIA